MEQAIQTHVGYAEEKGVMLNLCFIPANVVGVSSTFIRTV